MNDQTMREEFVDRRGRRRQRPDLADWREFLTSPERADLAKIEKRRALATKVLHRVRRDFRLMRDRCQQRRKAAALRALARRESAA